jgi:hypothetical protein
MYLRFTVGGEEKMPEKKPAKKGGTAKKPTPKKK